MVSAKVEAIDLGRTFAQLARPQNTRISLLLFIALALRMRSSFLHILFGALLIILVYSIVTALNDKGDLEADRINKRNLPLATGALNNSQVNIFICASAILILLAQPFLRQPAGIIFTLSYVGLGWLYSMPPFNVSHRGMFGPILLSICYTGLPLYLAIFQSSHPQAAYLTILFAIIPFSMASLLFKDYKDQKGDLTVGKLTPLLRYGALGIKALAWVLTMLGGVAAYLLQPLPSLWIACYIVMLLSLIFISRQVNPSQQLLRVYSYSAALLVICIIYLGNH